MAVRSGNTHRAIREFRDAVHGFVKLTDAEVDVVNSAPFRRLRDIRQLAMGHMVYPGANHTRFEHSLGCLHLASQMLDLLVERAQEGGGMALEDAFHAAESTIVRGRKILRLAALLHDVGHPPFSHSGEELLRKGATHETMTASIIRETELAHIIDDHYSADGISAEDVIVVATSPDLSHEKSKATAFNLFLNQILTGELGADRIDYLLRDALHSGQPTGRFDHLKLMNAMALVPQPEEEGGDPVLGLDEGGWLVAEQMVAARYLMYISLYFHKTKRIYERHLTAFMKEWLPNGKLPKSVGKYVGLSDSTILAAIEEAGRRPRAKGHSHAIRFTGGSQNGGGRGHLRLAKEIILADNCLPDNRSEQQGRRVPDRNRFDRLLNHVSMMSGVGQIEHDVADHSATKMFAEDSKILVMLDGKPRYLEEISEIVRGMSAKIWRGRLYCEKRHKEAVRAACDEFLSQNPPGKETSDGEDSE